MTYAPVNGLQLYYETRGTGRPLVLLHGGLMTIDLTFGPLLEPLAASRQVIAVEPQGRGRPRPRALRRVRGQDVGHGARVPGVDRRAAITAGADHADLRRPRLLTVVRRGGDVRTPAGRATRSAPRDHSRRRDPAARRSARTDHPVPRGPLTNATGESRSTCSSQSRRMSPNSRPARAAPSPPRSARD